jgi:CRISPR-associated protein Csy1
MMDSSADASKISALKALIHGFIQQRLQAKLEKLSEGEQDKHQQLLEEHRPDAWLQDAARRVGQIQLVNFGLKFTHPDARGSSLYLRDSVHAPTLVGTHSLGIDRDDDVVGNAAALDVYKFLKLEHAGKSLLQRACEADPALHAALSEQPEQAAEWLQAFAGIVESKGPPTSHKLAKQLYFPLPEGSYHLLAPLFPTSLVHRVYGYIQRDRFSEEAQAARSAYREKRPWAHGYREYPNLVIQKFGGTKPQNISQLNSERRGENYLLPSLPPNWRRTVLKPPTQVQSVFIGWFARRQRVRELSKALREFLARTRHNNLAIRQARQHLVAGLCDELLQFAAELQELPPGWSAASDCQLDNAEALWLDPYRGQTDAPFASQRRRGDWCDEICSRFGKWLNHALQSGSLTMGDAEYRQWFGDLDAELKMIRLEIGQDE